MKIKFFALMLFNTLLITSCVTSGVNDPFSKEIELTSNIWGVADSLGVVYDIAVGDNYLFLRNKYNNSLLSAISLNNRAEIFNFGVRGRAADELVSPGPMVVVRDTVSVYDAGKQSIMKFGFDASNKEYNFCDRIDVKLSGVTSMVDLIDNGYVMSGLFSDGRFCIVNGDGESKKYVGDYLTGSKNMDSKFHVLGMAYYSKVRARGDGKRVVAACRYAGLLEVYDYDQQNLVKVSEYNLFSPSYGTRDYMGSPQFSPNKETRWGYISVTSNDNYIFALYSGKIQRSTDDYFTSDIVDVFDWNGAQICRLKLDAKSHAITANEYDLYSLIKDSKERFDIAQYKLSL